MRCVQNFLASLSTKRQLVPISELTLAWGGRSQMKLGRKRWYRRAKQERGRLEESLYWHAVSWLSRWPEGGLLEWYAMPDRQSVGIVLPDFAAHLDNLALHGNVVDGRAGPHWSFVSPRCYDQPPGIQLPTPCDVTVVNIIHNSTNDVVVSATARVSDVPDKLRLPSEALPERPYRLEIHGGWSDQAIDESLGFWTRTHVNRPFVFRNIAVPAGENDYDDWDDDAFDFGDDATIGTEDVDRLLSCGMDTAAGLCRSIKAAISAIRGTGQVSASES